MALVLIILHMVLMLRYWQTFLIILNHTLRWLTALICLELKVRMRNSHDPRLKVQKNTGQARMSLIISRITRNLGVESTTDACNWFPSCLTKQIHIHKQDHQSEMAATTKFRKQIYHAWRYTAIYAFKNFYNKMLEKISFYDKKMMKK